MINDRVKVNDNNRQKENKFNMTEKILLLLLLLLLLLFLSVVHLPFAMLVLHSGRQ